MSSTTKALELLSHFSAARPEIGLSQMCRLAKRDKATTYRHLTALETSGFVEQNQETRQYRLGPALLQLGRVRELTVPREAGAEAAMTRLADVTGETAHVSVLSGTTLYALASKESPRHSTRAIIDIDTFPLHATASGLCALAFGPEALLDNASMNLKQFTATTPATPDALHQAVGRAREVGFGQSDGQFETEVHSISAPLFDGSGHFVGAVTVAGVASRLDAALERLIKEGLVQASRDITRNWGGQIPAEIERTWAENLATTARLDTVT